VHGSPGHQPAQIGPFASPAIRRHESKPPDGPTRAVAQATLDRVPELFERRGLSATEVRVLLALLNWQARLSDLAEAPDQRPNEITRAVDDGARVAYSSWRACR